MQPTDFPIGLLFDLRQDLRRRSEAEHVSQRTAPGARASQLVAHLEAALAYSVAGSMVADTTMAIINDIDRTAAQQAQEASPEVHPWPIEGMENVSGDNRYPQWSAETETAHNPELAGFLSLKPAFTGNGDMILEYFETPGAPDDISQYPRVMVRISQRAWRMLDTLARRIAAGQPIPYNEDGNVMYRADSA